MTLAEQLIRAEIDRRGVIPFARFMELALYAPGAGYYETPGREIGRRGDFYTSVSVGPAFGALLAWQIRRWCGDWEHFQIVEAGAHDGQLAKDILTALEECSDASDLRFDYRIIEPSAVRQLRQRERLARFGRKVTWFAEWTGVSSGGIRGVIVANELLDAFPVHRLGWDARVQAWFEWGVTAPANQFEWARMPVSESASAEQPHLPTQLRSVLPDGFVVEVCPLAAGWWRSAACALHQGWLVTFDYGLAEAGPGLRPERAGGTLRAYSDHHLASDLLARPGEQDLTAHLDFARIRRAGEEVGLVTETLMPQGRWLAGVAVEFMREGGRAMQWLDLNAAAFKTLINPAQLGHVLRVLVQRRDPALAQD